MGCVCVKDNTESELVLNDKNKKSLYNNNNNQ